MHPPRGCLKHVRDQGLIVLSQEQLSQTEYTYHPGHQMDDSVDPSLMQAVFRLELQEHKKLKTIGTAVVCESSGICLTANHCLEDLPRRPKLFIGGHPAKICAQDEKKDIAALRIDNSIDHQCIKLSGTCEIRRTMKVHLISYPLMADTEYEAVGPTITHGQVVNFWTPNVVGADYMSFPNSSGGAVIHGNLLIGIHQESIWNEDPLQEGEIGINGKVSHLIRNMSNKGCLANFINAAAICNFLDDHNVLPMRIHERLSSTSSSVRRGKSRMVHTPQ